MTAEEHFRRLHEAAYTDLMRFVRRRVPDDEIDDIVSTVFMVAWRRLGELPDDAVPWLFGVARKVMAAQARVRYRRSVVDVRMVEDEISPAEDDHTPGVAARIDLVRAWWTLSAADREVLALVAFDGLTDTQAATVLGCRPTTYRMRLSRARRRLREAMSRPAPNHPKAPGNPEALSRPGLATTGNRPPENPLLEESPARNESWSPA